MALHDASLETPTRNKHVDEWEGGRAGLFILASGSGLLGLIVVGLICLLLIAILKSDLAGVMFCATS